MLKREVISCPSLTRITNGNITLNIKRRTLLKNSLATGILATILGNSLFNSRQALAARPTSAFEKKSIVNAIGAISQGAKATKTKRIDIKAPVHIENGALVPVIVTTDIPNVEKISLLVEKNSPVLVASFDLASSCDGYVSTRIKMKKTSKIIAIVQADGKFYQNQKTVNVSIGKC